MFAGDRYFDLWGCVVALRRRPGSAVSLLNSRSEPLSRFFLLCDAELAEDRVKTGRLSFGSAAVSIYRFFYRAPFGKVKPRLDRSRSLSKGVVAVG